MPGMSGTLSLHHDRIEAALAQVVAAARAADWAGYRGRLAALRALTLDHIAFVEQEVFPGVAAALGGDAEILPLLEEHESLRRFLDTLAAAAPEYDPNGCIRELEALHAVVRDHHARELRVCYPAADRLPGAPALEPPPAAASAAIDLRGLHPPEPIVRIFAALERSPEAPLRAILPHEPVPLYALLRERGFRYSGTARPDGGYELLIERA